MIKDSPIMIKKKKTLLTDNIVGFDREFKICLFLRFKDVFLKK
jgi:hypothetical protein